MARPLKTGLDYFPLDVNIDDNIELIEAEHGIEGFAILIKLWQKIYANGYYIEWNEDMSLLFSRKINASVNMINDVINSCFKRNLFNKKMYFEHGILTSKGIQKRFITACSSSRRKNITFEKAYVLVETPYFELITEFTELTHEETELNHDESTQSKVKESKVKESKEPTAPAEDDEEIPPPKIVKIDELFEKFWETYPKKVGRKAAHKAFVKLKPNEELLKTMISAIDRAMGMEQWQKDNGQFIPNPTTWINQERWKDEIVVVVPISKNNRYTATRDKKYTEEELEALLVNKGGRGS